MPTAAEVQRVAAHCATHCAGGLVPEWSTIDLSNSDGWMCLHAGEGPTVTASHDYRAIFATAPVNRFLLPQEHAMLQGMRREQIQAATEVFRDAPRTLARIAGNAIPMETNLVRG